MSSWSFAFMNRSVLGFGVNESSVRSSGHRGAPLRGVAADRLLERRPPRRVELQLQERGARVTADVVRLRRVRSIEDVGVAVRCAGGGRELRRRLVVAE